MGCPWVKLCPFLGQAALSHASATFRPHSPFELGALLFRCYPKEIFTGIQSDLMKS